MIELYKMMRNGRCRPCGTTVKVDDNVIKTSAYGSRDTAAYICLQCARDIAKIVLEKEDLNEFGQELVIDKLGKK